MELERIPEEGLGTSTLRPVLDAASRAQDMDKFRLWGEQQEKKRLDYGKPRPDLLPPDALLAVAVVLAFGVEKHGTRTWEAGRPWGGEYGAVLRHLWAWWGGQENDAETGLPHLAHAAARILMLLAMTKRGVGVDERKT